MALFERRLLGSILRGRRRRAVAAGLITALLSGAAQAGPPPPPAYDVPRPPANDPLVASPPSDLAPGPGIVVAHRDPPPLPIAMRVLYAPFYATGLVLRYGIHYLLVAPFEVLGRTLTYGVEGGVNRDHEGPSDP